MDLKLLFAAIFLFAIASAIISDASRLVIPNWVPAVLAVSFFPYALVYHGGTDALLHVLVAIGLLGVGMFIRLSVLESPLFAQLKEPGKPARAPIFEVLRRYPLCSSGRMPGSTVVE